jgi:hypothetical protein
MYWKPQFSHQPKWSDHWRFEDGDGIPNQARRGCYSLFKNDEIIYIGVGIGKSTERYSGAGLGDRLKRYWKVDRSHNPKTKYTTRSNWKQVTSIVTIGFDDNHYHLATALEIYLIPRLTPKENKVQNCGRIVAILSKA